MGGWQDEEPTRVDRRLPRTRGEGDFQVEAETQRMRLDEVDRRALPFRKQGDRRNDRRAQHIEPLVEGLDSDEMTATGMVRPISEPPLPFTQSSPPSRPPPGFSSNPPPRGESVWTVEPMLNPADLPSALAPRDDVDMSTEIPPDHTIRNALLVGAAVLAITAVVALLV